MDILSQNSPLLITSYERARDFFVTQLLGKPDKFIAKLRCRTEVSCAYHYYAQKNGGGSVT